MTEEHCKKSKAKSRLQECFDFPLPQLKSRIASQRKSKRITQRQLADALDTTENTIISWEKEFPEWMARIITLCELCECSPDSLLENLPRLRKSMNLSQRQLAKMIGMTKNTYSNWERGGLQKNGYIIRLNYLYQALGCSSLKDLYDDDFVVR